MSAAKAKAAWPIEDAPAPLSVAGKALSSRGERTRANILEAAETVFADLGYYDASVVKITEAAGVAQGTFYLYFESKQQLFDELVVDLNRRVRRAMSEGAAGATSRVEIERGGFRAFFGFIVEHPGLYRIIRQAEIVSPGALRDHYSRIAAGYVAGLRAAMDADEIADGDAEVLAWALMGVGELVGLRWVLWNDLGGVPDEIFEQMYTFVRRGLGAAEQAGSP